MAVSSMLHFHKQWWSFHGLPLAHIQGPSTVSLLGGVEGSPLSEVQNACSNNRVHIEEVDQVISCGHVFLNFYYCGIHGKRLPIEMFPPDVWYHDSYYKIKSLAEHLQVAQALLVMKCSVIIYKK